MNSKRNNLQKPNNSIKFRVSITVYYVKIIANQVKYLLEISIVEREVCMNSVMLIILRPLTAFKKRSD